MLLKKFILLWIPVFAWMLVIFSFSSLPTGTASEIHWQDFIIKKMAHLVEYAVLATLSFRALIGSGVNRKDTFVIAFLIAIFYGATDEIHQSFTPGREPTVRDVIIDSIGAGIALLCIKNLLPKGPGKLRLWANKLGLI